MMKLITSSAFLIAITIMISGQCLFAQNFSEEQLAVWHEVESKWKNWKDGNLDIAFKNIDDEFLGWNDTNELPVTKEQWVKSMKETQNIRSDINFKIEPVSILVRKDAAVVHYHFEYSFLFDTGEGIHKIANDGRWSEFFFRENEQWMLLGEFTYHRLKE